jgi:N-acetylglucosamine malate deacetylase 2
MLHDVLVVSAHPDDETIGASTWLGSALAVVHVTDGAPRNMDDARRYGFESAEQYAAARRRELESALQAAAVAPQLFEIGVPDQGATYEIPRIAAELRRIIHAVRPRTVITHPYEGGHPDHDASAVAVRLACLDVPVWEYACYHNNGGQIRTGCFLDHDDSVQTAYDCFVTQREILTWFPIEVERFRPAPAYDFTHPPHEGRLFYEQFDWGMTGDIFRRIAREALVEC